MIVEFFINLFKQLALFLFSILPETSFGIDFSFLADWSAFFIESLNSFAFLLPVRLILFFLTIIFSIELVLVFFKLGRLIANLIRGSGA